MIVDVVIPALNEEDAIGLVINDIPKDLVRNIYVVDNASTDKTPEVAKEAGAIVVKQNQRGYGAACLAGIERIKNSGQFPDILVFLDGDYSDHPEQMPNLTQPIITNKTDMVIGSRALGNRESGSMMPQQVFGNWLATFLIRMIYGFRYSDLGPFRAIRWSALEKINMQDRDFGWTVEMQIKALKHKLAISEVPVDYRQRRGHSKIAGTVKGTVLAGYKIIYTIFKYAK
ncbi:glycosyltransferase family 2 protein [Luteibaculum oceani]|uniref:Glycosyltransferase family 2 protein n=1 Tax=Luteibaculum oceani TaxID=1294296 RepID=A0A5C6V140_9FLAO|nr:glycosyltransferase family 2 protein [Luteibaculum oceani]TXC76998.1 glycosyltransferase family 2 protein [Luteibaculum oceani]